MYLKEEVLAPSSSRPAPTVLPIAPEAAINPLSYQQQTCVSNNGQPRSGKESIELEEIDVGDALPPYTRH